ncbi:MAG: DUF6377 domain-containing protein, partial [Pseudobacter sp.]|uniref:DUF6377 domain-containing protein n=1 Tax=Pseudobacter sp. TaxID=2045420 RepID=UPI003F80BFC9
MRFVLLLFFIFPLFSYAQNGAGIQGLLNELDAVIINDNEYAVQKEKTLQQLKDQLNTPHLTRQDLYSVYQKISREYETYICDSAIVNSGKALALATELKNISWINESSIHLARCEARAGMFINTINRLNRIRREELTNPQRASFYATYIDAYIYWLEYQNGYETGDLLKEKERYQDSLLHLLQPSTYEYAIRKGFHLIEKKQLDSAAALLNDYFTKVKDHSEERAGVASILSFLYKVKQDRQKEKEYLIISAMADIKSAIRENISLRTLSIILFEEGDIRRADKYIKKSLDDANFYNARLRNIQASRILPIIDKAYQEDREKQQARQRMLLIAVSILSVILIISVLLIWRQVRALRLAQKEVLLVNNKLKSLNSELLMA